MEIIREIAMWVFLEVPLFFILYAVFESLAIKMLTPLRNSFGLSEKQFANSPGETIYGSAIVFTFLIIFYLLRKLIWESIRQKKSNIKKEQDARKIFKIKTDNGEFMIIQSGDTKMTVYDKDGKKVDETDLPLKKWTL